MHFQLQAKLFFRLFSCLQKHIRVIIAGIEMGRRHHMADPLLSLHPEHRQRFCHICAAVIHAGQDMAVKIRNHRRYFFSALPAEA